jgi:hypothetical protein
MSRITACFALALSLSACGPTLVRTSNGWHDERAPYYVTPGSAGELMSSQWALVSHERKDGGYRQSTAAEYGDDLEFTRIEDDGMMIVVSDRLPAGSLGKLSGVLVDRWMDQNVVNPDGDAYALYERLVRPLVSTTTVRGPMIYGARATQVSGRNAEVLRREDFDVPGGQATELVANLVPAGAPGPDLSLYLAVFKHAYRDEMILVGYSNTPNMFERGLPDAISFAHRLKFE